jgi:hypothetical protein
LTKTNKLLLSLILVACMLSAAAFAGTEQDPQELLSKSFQQADLWNQGPVKVVAKVHVDNANGDLRNLQYTVSWVGPEKWRAEWSAPGLHQITILNNGKLSYVSNRPKILWSTIWFEAALAALDGGTPAGPYLLAPLAYENAKLHASKKKINETEARCLAFGEPKTTLCIDPASGHLLTADGSLGSFEYSNYTSVGNNSYPQTVKVSYVTTSFEYDGPSLWASHAKNPVEGAQMTVTRGEQFPDSLFAAPEKSTTADFASCADLATNFTAPDLEKSVKAKRPKAAVEAHTYGLVWVLAAVGKDGSVQGTKVLSGPRELRSGVTSAVQQYKYTPYMRCGQAVEFRQVVGVGFDQPHPVYAEPQPPQPTYPQCFPCGP